MSYVLLFCEEEILVEKFILQSVGSLNHIFNYDWDEDYDEEEETKSSEGVFSRSCFSTVWEKPQAMMGFFADISLITDLNSHWNERFPALKIDLEMAGIGRDGYEVSLESKELNFAVLIPRYKELLYNMPILWVLPLLVHRIVGKDEGFWISYMNWRKDCSPLDAAFLSGQVIGGHNISNPLTVDLYEVFDMLSDKSFVDKLSENLLEKYHASEEFGKIYRQTKIFSLINKEMKEWKSE